MTIEDQAGQDNLDVHMDWIGENNNNNNKILDQSKSTECCYGVGCTLTFFNILYLIKHTRDTTDILFN